MADGQETTTQFNLAQLLRIPFQTLVTELHARLDAAGYGDIRPPHSVVFAHLGAEGLRLTELARRAQLTKQLVGYLVDSLAEHGYVERIPDPGDGRARLVRLTEKGMRASEAGAAIIADIEHEWAQMLGAEEMAQLRMRLTRLIAMLDEKRL